MKSVSQYLNEVPQYIDSKRLCEIMGISSSTVRRRHSVNDPGYDPNFPQKIYIGERIVRYDLADVLRYLKEKKQCNF